MQIFICAVYQMIISVVVHTWYYHMIRNAVRDYVVTGLLFSVL